jgi:hypothetical protein
MRLLSAQANARVSKPFFSQRYELQVHMPMFQAACCKSTRCHFLLMSTQGGRRLAFHLQLVHKLRHYDIRSPCSKHDPRSLGKMRSSDGSFSSTSPSRNLSCSISLVMLRYVFADLARIALVAAAYPLTIANSIASCIWNNPVDSLPQSPTCTAWRIDRMDFSSAYASCGPPAIQGDRCCDVLLVIAGAFWFDFVDRTGLLNYEVSSGATKC